MIQQNVPRKSVPVQPVKNHDGLTVLQQSIPIVERLFCWVNGESFSIDDSLQIDLKNANALWDGCKCPSLIAAPADKNLTGYD